VEGVVGVEPDEKFARLGIHSGLGYLLHKKRVAEQLSHPEWNQRLRGPRNHSISEQLSHQRAAGLTVLPLCRLGEVAYVMVDAQESEDLPKRPGDVGYELFKPEHFGPVVAKHVFEALDLLAIKADVQPKDGDASIVLHCKTPFDFLHEAPHRRNVVQHHQVVRVQPLYRVAQAHQDLGTRHDWVDQNRRFRILEVCRAGLVDDLRVPCQVKEPQVLPFLYLGSASPWDGRLRSQLARNN